MRRHPLLEIHSQRVGHAIDQKDAVTNVEISLSEPAAPKLPAGALDAVLIRNAYHEMVAYREILQGVKSGLKPGPRR